MKKIISIILGISILSFTNLANGFFDANKQEAEKPAQKLILPKILKPAVKNSGSKEVQPSEMPQTANEKKEPMAIKPAILKNRPALRKKLNVPATNATSANVTSAGIAAPKAKVAIHFPGVSGLFLSNSELERLCDDLNLVATLDKGASHKVNFTYEETTTSGLMGSNTKRACKADPLAFPINTKVTFAASLNTEKMRKAYYINPDEQEKTFLLNEANIVTISVNKIKQ